MDKIYVNVEVKKSDFELLQEGLKVESGQAWDRVRVIRFLEKHMSKIVPNFIAKSYGRCDKCGSVFFRKTSNQKRCKGCQK